LLAFILDFWWLLQELTTSVDSIGFTQPETLAENGRQVLGDATNKLRVDDEWDVIDKAVQAN
jgi:hypothetical protein